MVGQVFRVAVGEKVMPLMTAFPVKPSAIRTPISASVVVSVWPSLSKSREQFFEYGAEKSPFGVIVRQKTKLVPSKQLPAIKMAAYLSISIVDKLLSPLAVSGPQLEIPGALDP